MILDARPPGRDRGARLCQHQPHDAATSTSRPTTSHVVTHVIPVSRCRAGPACALGVLRCHQYIWSHSGQDHPCPSGLRVHACQVPALRFLRSLCPELRKSPPRVQNRRMWLLSMASRVLSRGIDLLCARCRAGCHARCPPALRVLHFCEPGDPCAVRAQSCCPHLAMSPQHAKPPLTAEDGRVGPWSLAGH